MASTENPLQKARAVSEADPEAPPPAAPPAKRKSMLDTFYTPEFQAMLQNSELRGCDEDSTISSHDGDEELSDAEPNSKADRAMQTAVANAVAKAAVSVRLAFVRKVMAIFFLQLGVTSAIAAIVVLTPAINQWLGTNPYWVLGAWGLCIAMLAVAVCAPSSLRGLVPCLVFLAAFSVAQGAVIGFMFVVIAANAVIVAVIATAGAVIGIVCMTVSESLGLSKCAVTVVSCLTALTVFVVVGIIGGIVTLAGALTGGFLSILFCAFIASDILAIVGGKHRCYQFSLDEALLAATCLYVDVLGLFMYSISCAASAMVRT